MKRPLRPDEISVWSLVTGTVHPLPGRAASRPPEAKAAKTKATDNKGMATPAHLPPLKSAPGKAPKPAPRSGLDGIEPNRRHRIARDRETITARLDLHGLDQERAHAVLDGFLRRAWDEGSRAVLIITGKGVQGDGVLRRRVPEWLAAPHLTPIVAGISQAARQHGGEGALYVALKRKPRT